MLRFIAASLAIATVGVLFAEPTPEAPDAKALVAKLSDPDQKVRQAASEALFGRTDALPWVRRAARSQDKDTAGRASALLTPHETNRRGAATAKAIDACIRDGSIDLLTEWHQYWKPREEAELWAVGPRAAKAGLELYAKSCPPAEWAEFEQRLAATAALPFRSHDGPCPERFVGIVDVRTIRTDRMDRLKTNEIIRFASVGGPIRSYDLRGGGTFLALGPIQTGRINTAFVACDGDVWKATPEFGSSSGIDTQLCVVVCRGHYAGERIVYASVLLVDGDIDLTQTDRLRDCLIRASGEIRLPPNVKPVNCTIEAHAKNATAPYKFFELADVGLSVADDEEGLVVTAVKADTPFGTGGLAKGDLIRFIDDAPAGHSEPFRKAVRRALVRQGDCLLTVVRGDKTLDLPVFFPLPK